jgi:hypothetical protein
VHRMEASAGFEPAVEVLQIAICGSPEFAEVHCGPNFSVHGSLLFIAYRQSSAALPSPLPSTTPWITGIPGTAASRCRNM